MNFQNAREIPKVYVSEIEDTREKQIVVTAGGRERVIGIPGTGIENECYCCGKKHEIHAHVQTPQGKLLMGTGCAKKVAGGSELISLFLARQELANQTFPGELIFGEEEVYKGTSQDYWGKERPYEHHLWRLTMGGHEFVALKPWQMEDVEKILQFGGNAQKKGTHSGGTSYHVDRFDFKERDAMIEYFRERHRLERRVEKLEGVLLNKPQYRSNPLDGTRERTWSDFADEFMASLNRNSIHGKNYARKGATSGLNYELGF